MCADAEKIVSNVVKDLIDVSPIEELTDMFLAEEMIGIF